MIPLKIAKALKRLVECAEPPDSTGRYPGVHLITDEDDTVVFVESANKVAAIQITYDDANLEPDWFDIVIPHDELCAVVKAKTDYIPDFAEFDGVSDWPDIDSALDEFELGEDEGVAIWPRSGLQLQFLHAVSSALRDVFGKNAYIRMTQGEYKGPITFKADLRDNDIEMIIYLMPILLWNDVDE